MKKRTKWLLIGSAALVAPPVAFALLGKHGAILAGAKVAAVTKAAAAQAHFNAAQAAAAAKYTTGTAAATTAKAATATKAAATAKATAAAKAAAAAKVKAAKAATVKAAAPVTGLTGQATAAGLNSAAPHLVAPTLAKAKTYHHATKIIHVKTI